MEWTTTQVAVAILLGAVCAAYFGFVRRWLRLLRLYTDAKNVSEQYSGPARGWRVLCNPGEKEWINVGWWVPLDAKPDAALVDTAKKTYGQAGDDLALRVARAAKLKAGQTMLDVGCGYGSSSVLFAEKLGVTVTGMNICEYHITEATARAAKLGAPITSRVKFVVGDACDMKNIPDNSLDVVLGLECIFHFPSREKFWQECMRVLKPGGRVAMADLVLLPHVAKLNASYRTWAPKWLLNLIIKLSDTVMVMPVPNQVEQKEYERIFKATGFTDVQIDNVTEVTSRPFEKYCYERFAKVPVREGDDLDEAFRVWMKLTCWLMRTGTDYIIASGQKPLRA